MQFIQRKTGSGILPYISHPQDKDVLVIFFNEDEFNQEKLTRIYKNQLHDRGLDAHCVLASAIPTTARVWTYVYHFIEPIEGITCPDIYILHDEILKVINQWVADRPHAYRAKHLYHVYTTLAMWRNGNYELTTDDIARINRFHDHCATDEDFDILRKMLEQENKNLMR